MRARTVSPSRIAAMFNAIGSTKKLLGRLLAFYYTYRYIFTSSRDRAYLLRYFETIFSRLVNDGVITNDVKLGLQNVSIERVCRYVTDAALRREFESLINTAPAKKEIHSTLFQESLLMSKDDIHKKMLELKDTFPERFEKVSDDELLNELKDISIDYLDGCTYLTFGKQGDDKDETIVDLTGNSSVLDKPEYRTLMEKTFEEVVDDWLREHNLTHGDLVWFRFDPSTNQMFVEFDANNVDFDVPEQDDTPFDDDADVETESEEPVEEDPSLDESFTYDALTRYEKELTDVLTKEQISYDSLDVEEEETEAGDTLKVTVEIDGDWKHDHLYCMDLIKYWAAANGFDFVDEDSQITREEGSDDYGAIHYYYLKPTGDQPIREDAIQETYSDEELDQMIGKTFNQQKIQNIYRRQKYNDNRLFAHTRCVNCGREKRVFLSNLINDPDKYGSCVCSDTNVESRLDNIHDLFDGSKKLSSNTSGYTGVSYIKTSKGQLYDK